jgi:hypothetical protein
MLLTLLQLALSLAQPAAPAPLHDTAVRYCWVSVYTAVAPDAVLYVEDRDAAGNDVGYWVADDTSELGEAIGALLCEAGQ